MIDKNELERRLTPVDRRLCAERLGFHINGHKANKKYWIDGIEGPQALGEGKNGSFSFNENTGAWIDHGGSENTGDLYKAVREVRRCSFPEAIEWIAAQIGMKGADTAKANPKKKPSKPPYKWWKHGEHVRLDTWKNADGSEAKINVRYEPKKGHPLHGTGRKDIIPYHYDPSNPKANDKGYVTGYDGPPLLFRWPELVEAVQNGETVFICEGEPATEAVRSLGLAATTSGGFNSWDDELAPHLKGANVAGLVDNDPPGRKYGREVVESLHGTAKSIKIVELPGLPPKGDAVEWIEAGGTREQLLNLVNDAPEWEPDTDGTGATDNPTNDEGNKNAKEEKERGSRGYPEWVPFPVDALPHAAADYSRAASPAATVDPAMIAVPMLSVLSAGIGATRRVQIKRNWHEKATVWTASVSRSGTTKSAGLEAALKPVNRIERELRERYEEELEYYEEQKRAYDLQDKAGKQTSGAPPQEPTRERRRVSDTTIESVLVVHEENLRGLLLARDELAGWIGSFDRYANGESDMAAWIELYEGRYVQVDRKSSAKKVLDVERPSVSITGTIQPGTLTRKLTQDHLDAGFGQRIMFAMPPERESLWTEADVTADVYAAYETLVRDLYALQLNEDAAPHIVELTSDAKRLFIEWYNDGRQLLQAAPNGPLRSVYAKCEAMAARLALVFQMCESDGDITADAMRRGISVAAWLRYEAARVYALLDLEEAAKEPIYRFLGALPLEFKKAEAEALAGEFDVSERTVREWLQKLVSTGQLVRVIRGLYRKNGLTGGGPDEKTSPTSSFPNFLNLHKEGGTVKKEEAKEKGSRGYPANEAAIHTLAPGGDGQADDLPERVPAGPGDFSGGDHVTVNETGAARLLTYFEDGKWTCKEPGDPTTNYRHRADELTPAEDEVTP